MANSVVHAVVGAVAGIAPDVVLILFGWRKVWLPKHHPLVRAHRFLHSYRSIPWLILIAWISHIVIDKHSRHRRQTTNENRTSL